ncbi:MAG: tetratricopeptide repeat protein [Pseudomonadota bacterium]
MMARIDIDKDSPRRIPSPLIALIIIAATVLAYSPVYQADFIWDDDQYVVENQHLKSADGLKRIWFEPGATPQYYPLVFSTFWIEEKLWGLSPIGYHAVNVFLHALGALLLWMVLMRLKVPWAWAFGAGLVFALHPVHVESVAWITERKNVLSGVFYLASALAMIAWLRVEAPDSEKFGPRPLYALGFFLFMGALMSKTVTCSLPAALLLIVWWQQGRVGLKTIIALTPFFFAGIVFGLMTVWLERAHVGAEGAEWSFTILERCLIAGRAIWFYAGKLIWPHPLVFNYPAWTIDATALWQYLYPTGVIALIGALWLLRRRLGRGPLAGVLFFCGTLFPALGFFNVYPFRFSFVADHFQYHASIGLIVLGVMALNSAAVRPGKTFRAFPAGILALFIAAFGWQTYRQCPVYQDLETLWTATIQRNPSAWLAHNNLANLMTRQGRFDAAAIHHIAALKYRPDPEVSHNNLADTLVKGGKVAEAEPHFQTALRIRPDYALAMLNYGFLKEAQGDVEAARHLYEQAITVAPEYAEAHLNLGQIHDRQGRPQEAERHFRAALRYRPAMVEAYIALGGVLARRGDLEDARDAFAEALQRRSDAIEAHYNLGLTLTRMGNSEDALGHFSEALRINPRFSDAHLQVGKLMAGSGKLDAARQRFSAVLRIDPENAEAHLHLGLVEGLGGRFDEAIGHLQRSVQLEPTSVMARFRLAQSYWLAGRHEEARVELERLKPMNAAKAEALAAFMKDNGAS